MYKKIIIFCLLLLVLLNIISCFKDNKETKKQNNNKRKELGMNSNKSLDDYQNEWNIICDKAFTEYSELSFSERIWFNVQCLINAVNNGGIISYYYNNGADYYYETINDLKILEQNKIIILMERSAKIFPNNIVPKNIDERNNVISNLPEGKFDKELEEIDEIFFNNENELEQSLINYLIKYEIIK